MIDCSKCAAYCCKAVKCPLLQNDRCPIYETRPDICDTDIMFEVHYSHTMTREQYDALALESCKRLKEIHDDQIRNTDPRANANEEQETDN